MTVTMRTSVGPDRPKIKHPSARLLRNSAPVTRHQTPVNITPHPHPRPLHQVSAPTEDSPTTVPNPQDQEDQGNKPSLDLMNVPKWISGLLPLFQQEEAYRVTEWKELVHAWINVEGEQGFANVVNGPVSFQRYHGTRIRNSTFNTEIANHKSSRTSGRVDQECSQAFKRATYS